MKLSELIAYRNLLLKPNIQDIVYQSEREFDSIVHTVKTSPIQIRSHTQTLEEDLVNTRDIHNQFKSTLNEIIIGLNLEIETEEKSYYENSLAEYNKITHNRYNHIVYSEDILKRIIQITPDARLMITNRIKSYIDWKNAGMIIRPGREDFIKHLVECDPLYIVDHDEELLKDSVADFNEEYQARIRHFYITDVSTHPNNSLIETIPNGQFGFCLAYNFFNFVAMEPFEQYLKEIFSKLKPGGILALTFNDCDYAHSVGLVEKNYSFYTPGKRVLAAAKSIGYKQMFSWTDGGDFTWLELRKPGALESLKGGQTLAKILPKTLAKSK
jgi:SAM-dependent methyltransferase